MEAQSPFRETFVAGPALTASGAARGETAPLDGCGAIPAGSACAARRVGLYGGSFDPPHRGHLHVARAAARASELEHVIFVPAARPPHKPERRLASALDRVAMLCLLLADEPGSSIWTVELARAGPSYTIDTVRELLPRLAPGARLHLILGADNLTTLPHWREVEELLRLARPVVVPRPGGGPPGEQEGLSGEARAALAEGRVDVEALDVSSTELRGALREGGGLAAAAGLTTPVFDYIRARDLYRRAEP